QRSASHSAGSPAQVSRSIREKQTLTPAEIASLPRGRWLVRAVGRRPILAASEPFWERDWDKKTKQLLSSKKGETMNLDDFVKQSVEQSVRAGLKATIGQI